MGRPKASVLPEPVRARPSTSRPAIASGTTAAWTSVGSTNFDNRSFRLNDEANLNIYDRGFAEQLERTFEADKTKSREVTYEAWLNRPWHLKLLERFWSLFEAQF